MQSIRYPRLHAFYDSKVSNALMVVLVSCLLIADGLMSHGGGETAPFVCAGLAFILYVAYAIWFWAGKPREVTKNRLLSDYRGYLVLYFLIIVAVKASGIWWHIVPAIISSAVLIAALAWVKDEHNA